MDRPHGTKPGAEQTDRRAVGRLAQSAGLGAEAVWAVRSLTADKKRAWHTVPRPLFIPKAGKRSRRSATPCREKFHLPVFTIGYKAWLQGSFRNTHIDRILLYKSAIFY